MGIKLTKKLRDGRTAVIIKTGIFRYEVTINHERLGGAGRLEKLPKRDGAFTHVLRVEGETAVIGLDEQEARHLSPSSPGPYTRTRRVRCTGCDGPLSAYGPIDGLRGDPRHRLCYDCQ